MATSLLVDEQGLLDRQGDSNVVLLDTRPAAEYWSGHLAGARHFDATLFAHADTSAAGLELLARQYAALFSLLGLSGREHVVVYENISENRAARAAWLLTYLGHPAVSILDGGLKAATRLPTETIAQPYSPQQFIPNIQAHLVVGADEILARLDDPSFQVLDTRRRAEFLGTEKRARRAGAIPGAVHLDYVENIGADGKFRSPLELRTRYRELGLKDDADIAAYCGGGVRAAHTWVALTLAGFAHARNYTGSWGEWGNRDDLPVTVPEAAATTSAGI